MGSGAYGDDKVHDGLLAKISASRNQFMDLSLNTRHRRVCGSLGSMRLSSSTYRLLWLLVRGQGAIITADEMWYFMYEEDEGDIPITNTIAVFISHLRKKLQKVSGSTAIVTERRGYRLCSRHENE